MAKTKSTKVVIDLGELHFEGEELSQLESAIQSTVLSKLGGFKSTGSLALGVIPGLKNPGWIGLVVRDLRTLDLSDETLNEIKNNFGQF